MLVLWGCWLASILIVPLTYLSIQSKSVGVDIIMKIRSRNSPVVVMYGLPSLHHVGFVPEYLFSVSRLHHFDLLATGPHSCPYIEEICSLYLSTSSYLKMDKMYMRYIYGGAENFFPYTKKGFQNKTKSLKCDEANEVDIWPDFGNQVVPRTFQHPLLRDILTLIPYVLLIVTLW